MVIVTIHPQDLTQEEIQAEMEQMKDYLVSCPINNMISLYYQSWYYIRHNEIDKMDTNILFLVLTLVAQLNNRHSFYYTDSRTFTNVLTITNSVFRRNPFSKSTHKALRCCTRLWRVNLKLKDYRQLLIYVVERARKD